MAFKIQVYCLLGYSLVYLVSGDSITVDGHWSPWSKLETACSRLNVTTGEWTLVTCGGGVKKRFRSCTNPSPQGLKPKGCSGVAEKSFKCNMQPCTIQWSEWSPCSAVCSRGLRRATTECTDTPGGEFLQCKDKFANHDYEFVQNCNTWNKTTCPSPCEGHECMEFASCVDVSSEEDPIPRCDCQLGRVKDSSGARCRRPDPTTPTPRPIPTIEPAVKTATSAVTKSASTVLIVLVLITVFLFASMKIFDVARVIQMNMEVALVSAHLCLLVPVDVIGPLLCRVVSILIHYFFTSCFMFMMLESLHVYSLVAKIVKRDGMFNKFQNMLVGWGVPAVLLCISVGLNYDSYGGEYLCWVRMNTSLVGYQLGPIIILMIATLALIEAAGSADQYAELPDPTLPQCENDRKLDDMAVTSATIMQRTNLVIMPLVFASFLVGALAEYEQSVVMYGTFTTINGCLGAAVLVMHTSGNGDVRKKLINIYHHFSRGGLS